MTAALVFLGPLAATALLACEMPLWLSAPLAVLVVAEGLRLARREVSRPEQQLVVTAAGQAFVDGRQVSDVGLQWRGPLAFLRFRDTGGRLQRLIWWPDTLPPDARRELRLAIPVQAAAQRPREMAS